ncbi:MAG TPA: hypothetical protein P5211_03020 [Anaerolineae bacterium]|nr:hypothetical protein [Anaerolineae bacterium]
MKVQANPVFVRQLYSGAHRSRFFWLLSGYVLLQGLLIWGALYLIGSGTFGGDEARISLAAILSSARQLYWFSSLLLLLAGGWLAPIAAIGELTGESEHRTFDLLRTTTLTSQAIVLGKWEMALLNGLLLLLAPLPMQLLGFWLGGVTVTELLLTQFFLFVVLMMNTALALAISARVRKTWIAVLIFYGIILGVIAFVGGGALFLSVEDIFPLLLPTAASLWQKALLQYGWVLLVGLHPLSAAISSVSLCAEQGAWFLLEFPVSICGPSVTSPTVLLPAPWLTHTLLALPATAFLLWRTARRIARPEV